MRDFLNGLGVENVGYDFVWVVGWVDLVDECEMGELCGSCFGNLFFIGFDGVVVFCNMLKNWFVGLVIE